MSQNNCCNRKKNSSYLYSVLCIALLNSYFMQHQYFKDFFYILYQFSYYCTHFYRSPFNIRHRNDIPQKIISKRTFHVRVLTIIRYTWKGTVFRLKWLEFLRHTPFSPYLLLFLFLFPWQCSVTQQTKLTSFSSGLLTLKGKRCWN